MPRRRRKERSKSRFREAGREDGQPPETPHGTDQAPQTCDIRQLHYDLRDGNPDGSVDSPETTLPLSPRSPTMPNPKTVPEEPKELDLTPRSPSLSQTPLNPHPSSGLEYHVHTNAPQELHPNPRPCVTDSLSTLSLDADPQPQHPVLHDRPHPSMEGPKSLKPGFSETWTQPSISFSPTQQTKVARAPTTQKHAFVCHNEYFIANEVDFIEDERRINAGLPPLPDGELALYSISGWDSDYTPLDKSDSVTFDRHCSIPRDEPTGHSLKTTCIGISSSSPLGPTHMKHTVEVRSVQTHCSVSVRDPDKTLRERQTGKPPQRKTKGTMGTRIQLPASMGGGTCLDDDSIKAARLWEDYMYEKSLPPRHRVPMPIDIVRAHKEDYLRFVQEGHDDDGFYAAELAKPDEEWYWEYSSDDGISDDDIFAEYDHYNDYAALDDWY